VTCFACIFVPDFPAEALLRIEPELRAQPVAVLAGKPPLEKVFAVNEKARRANVESGMTKVQLDAWTGLLLRPRSELQETAAHVALLDCAQSFSPCMEDTAPDTVLIDLEGLEHLFGSLPKIARDIAHRASNLGLEANVAVASNPGTAMLAARGFSGVTFIPEGKEAERLGELPVSVLFEGLLSAEQQKDAARILETLDRWGLRNLRALAALPVIPLSERLGQEGLLLQQLARGASTRTLKLVDLPLIFEEAVELEFPIVLLEPLAFVLNRMLEQLCNRLAARALAAQELKLRFELATEFQTAEFQTEDDGTPAAQSPPSRISKARTSSFSRTLHLPVPMLDARIFLKLLQLDLRAHPPGAPILKIHLAAEPARPRAAQSGLFLPATPEPEKLELTLARMSSVVGKENVGSIELLDTHRPESFRIQHFNPEGSKETKSFGKTTGPDKELPKTNQEINSGEKLSSRSSRPLALFAVEDFDVHDISIAVQTVSDTDTAGAPRPQEAPVTALRLFRPTVRAEVTMREGEPVRLNCPQRKDLSGEIIWTAGPWRSSGDWWEQEGWARDEWDIALQSETGFALYRLVRDHFSSRWFVEGSYD
jgi:protein ImuB